MKQIACFAMVLVAVAIPRPVCAQTKPAVALEAAMTKEQVDGDLAGAIAAYQKIAADTAAPRDVRAKALLRLAGCYEKLGRLAAKRLSTNRARIRRPARRRPGPRAPGCLPAGPAVRAFFDDAAENRDPGRLVPAPGDRWPPHGLSQRCERRTDL